jgi:hypothetical protein
LPSPLPFARSTIWVMTLPLAVSRAGVALGLLVYR